MALLAFICTACTTMDTLVTAVRPSPPDPKTQMAALERRIFELVEHEREKLDPKAKPLALDSELTGIARQRSEDMAAKRYMASKAPDGQTSATLIMAEDTSFQGLLGENIAAQYYTKAGGVDADGFAKRFVATWMASKSHRENLAFADYDRTGIGAAVNGDTVYVMQLFATDLGLKPPQTQQGTSPAGDTRRISGYSDPKAAKTGEPEKQAARLRGSMGAAAAGH